MRLAQGSSTYPKCSDGPATAATAETILVDGGGDQRQEVAGDEEDEPETQGGRAGRAWVRESGIRGSLDSQTLSFDRTVGL